MESLPLVYIVLLAWNHLDDTVECLNSFLRTEYDNAHFLVVDNGSIDGTSEHIRKHYPEVEIITSAENLGIARGYNLGMEYALQKNAKYVLVANNDIIVGPDFLNKLVEQGEKNPHTGILMPKIVYYDRPDRLWSTGARKRPFPPAIVFIGLNKPDGPAYSKPRELEFAPSCVLLIKCELMKKIGLFDGNFFFYWDDYDYCYRTRQVGYSINYVPNAVARHKVSTSTRHSDRSHKWWEVWGRSTAIYYHKHESLPASIVQIAWITAREILHGNFLRIPSFWKGVHLGFREARTLHKGSDKTDS